MSQTVITIPFQVLRLILPQDGEVLGFNLNENVWPKNKAKNPFEHHERVEFAFGRILRARQQDRRRERPNPPGFTNRQAHVEFQGGWRAHKKVPVAGDYFDGTFSGRLRFRHEGTAVTATVFDLEVKWNGGVVEPIANLIVGNVERKIRDIAEDKLNQLLSTRFLADLEGIFAKYPPLARLRDRARLTFEGTSLALTVETD
jgi:hypothetical protein